MFLIPTPGSGVVQGTARGLRMHYSPPCKGQAKLTHSGVCRGAQRHTQGSVTQKIPWRGSVHPKRLLEGCGEPKQAQPGATGTQRQRWGLGIAQKNQEVGLPQNGHQGLGYPLRDSQGAEGAHRGVQGSPKHTGRAQEAQKGPERCAATLCSHLTCSSDPAASLLASSEPLHSLLCMA